LAKADKTILAFELQLYFPTEQQLFNGMMEVKRQMRKKRKRECRRKTVSLHQTTKEMAIT
jgi:hypothetical protein